MSINVVSSVAANYRDLEDVMTQFQRRISAEQIICEYGISNPPMMEQYCSLLPETEQIPTLKKLVRMEAEKISIRGIETWSELVEFLSVLECYRKNNWLDVGEVDTILFEVRRWIDGDSDGGAELALMRIAFGLSHRMF